MSQPSSHPHRIGHVPALDGLRGIAIACVLLVHTTGYPPGGGLGVTLFFVLSGFLITTLLLQEHDETGTVSLRGFYRRRTLRLLPALLAFLGASVVLYSLLSAWRGEFDAQAFRMIGHGLTYSTNIALSGVVDAAAIGGDDSFPLGHLWSLAMEEQFYLAWPVLLVFALGVRRHLALFVVVGATVLMTAHAARLELSGESFQRIWFAPDSGAVAILVGCALALTPMWRGKAMRLGLVALPSLAGLVAIPVYLFTFPGASLLASIVCGALVVSALCDARLAGLLSARPLVYLGTISYGLYLWHELAMTLLGVKMTDWGPMSIPAIVLSLVLAVGSYYLIERRFLRRKTHRPRPTRSPAFAQALPDGRNLGAPLVSRP